METILEDSMTIPFGGKHLVAVLSIPANASDVQTAVILTHGAGGDMNFKHLVSLAHALSSNGLLCLRFTCKGLNLVYRVKAYHAVWEYLKNLEKFTIRNIFLGERCLFLSARCVEKPAGCTDSDSVSPVSHVSVKQRTLQSLMSLWNATLARISSTLLSRDWTLARSILGRSMGSRAASALARQLSGGSEDALQGLVCLSFPLHPPGQTHTHRQRSEDLRALPKEVPVLFLSGTADNMCEKILLDDVLKEMKSPATVHWIEGGSHGLIVKGRAEESVLDEVNSHVVSWILEHT
ncbi:testis-expressed protein 30 isoform X1 [Oncorhynchus masou masou]|uniref:testis-expressed protein 30 isoform X1 n=1 Tax=Oncorhynchus masou masou TaxID=90313 RepID=UPI0031845689